MQKALYLLCGLYLMASPGMAQKKVAFFAAPEANFGSSIGETVLETSQYTGFHDDFSRLENLGLTANTLERAYGLGMTGGVVFFDQLYFSTGIRYQRRQDWGTAYCYVCDFFEIPSPEKIRLDFFEIPAQARLDLIKGNRLRPFISAEAFRSYMLKEQEAAFFRPMKIKQWGYRLGAGLAYPFKNGLQVNFRSFFERDLGWGKRYPHYYYQVLGFSVGVLKKW